MDRQTPWRLHEKKLHVSSRWMLLCCCPTRNPRDPLIACACPLYHSNSFDMMVWRLQWVKSFVPSRRSESADSYLISLPWSETAGIELPGPKSIIYFLPSASVTGARFTGAPPCHSNNSPKRKILRQRGRLAAPASNACSVSTSPPTWRYWGCWDSRPGFLFSG